MVFSIVFLIGMALPFLFFKAKSNWLKWLPGILFLVCALGLGLKILINPAAEMAVLGEIVFSMLLGTGAIGSFISGVIITFIRK
jgi:cation transport ATPase